MPSKIHLKQSTESIFVKTTCVNCDYGLVDPLKMQNNLIKNKHLSFYS